MRTKLPFSTVPAIALFTGIFAAVIDTILAYRTPGFEFDVAVVMGLRSLGIMTTVVFLTVLIVWIAEKLLLKRKRDQAKNHTLVALQIVVGLMTIVFGYVFDSSTHKTVSLIKAQLLSGAMLLFLTPLLAVLIEKMFPRILYSLRSSVFTVLVLLTMVATYFSYPLEEKYSMQPAAASTLATSADGPNVILIVMDTARYDRFGFAGYSRPTSPELDRFAAESTMFDNAFSTSSWTLPAHASLFTGLYPSQHRANGEYFWLDDSYVTLAEILRDEGYQTVCMTNNGNVSPLKNTTQGFEQVWFSGLWRDVYLPNRSLVGGFLISLGWMAGKFDLPALNRLQAKLYGKKTTTGADRTNDAIYTWLDQRDSKKPFFLFINYMEPHTPYDPPKDIALKYVSEDDLKVAKKKGLHAPDIEDDINFEKSGLTREDIRIINGLYDGSIEMLDNAIGRLFEELRRRKLYSDSLIIVTSDHGEYLGRHNRLLHGFGLHDDVFKIPLLARYPKRFTAGNVISAPVSLIDIFETILAISGAEKRPPVKYDAIRLFDENIDESREVYGEVKFSIPLLRMKAFNDPSLKVFNEFKTVRDRRHHYIWHSREADELYDTLEDPNEVENLFPDNSTLATAMSGRLFGWFSGLEMPAADGRPQRQLSEREQHDQMNQLKALGYIK